MRNDDSILWFCPACVEALRPHIHAIVEVVGDGSIHWPHMVSFLKPKPEKKEDS